MNVNQNNENVLNTLNHTADFLPDLSDSKWQTHQEEEDEHYKVRRSHQSHLERGVHV